MAEKTEKTSSAGGTEREYVIPLRREWNKVPRYKRANKAIRTIKEFLARHMKVPDRDLNKIKLDRYLNEFVWFRGIRKPPAKIKVKAVKDGEIVKVELSELPKELAFKKAKLEKREEKAGIKKKPTEKPEEKIEKTEEEEKKKVDEETRLSEAESKKASVVEAGKEMEKAAAKTMKHQTKMSKQPKRQRRMALQK